MTKPIERYSKLKANLESALSQLGDFSATVDEISADPFSNGPSDTMMQATRSAAKAGEAIQQALDTLERLAAILGAQNGERPSVAIVDSIALDKT